MVYRFSAITVTINRIDTIAIQAATINALSSCFSVLTSWFCLWIFMVCLCVWLVIKHSIWCGSLDSITMRFSHIVPSVFINASAVQVRLIVFLIKGNLQA